MKIKKQRRGVSLIVLVITIIVMLILATTVIISLSNNGIIDKAREAVDKTNTAAEKEKLAELVVGTVNRRGVVDFDALDKLIAEDDTFEGTNGTYKGIATGNMYTVGSYGEVALLESRWIQDGDDIKFVSENGDVLKTLKIGDEIAYDEGTKGTYTTDASKGTGISYTSNTLNQGTYTVKGENGTVEAGDLSWLVLGVNDEGQVELISKEATTSSLVLSGKAGYLNAVTENKTVGTLDTFCNNIYGKGTGAISARSVKLEDIFKLQGIEVNDMNHKLTFKYYNGEFYYISSSKITDENRNNVDGWSNCYGGGWTFEKVYTLNGTIEANNPGPVEDIEKGYWLHYDDVDLSGLSENRAKIVEGMMEGNFSFAFANTAMLMNPDNSNYVPFYGIWTSNAYNDVYPWPSMGFDYFLDSLNNGEGSIGVKLRPVVTLEKESDILFK